MGLDRRDILRLSGAAALGLLTAGGHGRLVLAGREHASEEPSRDPATVTLFLGGDVMTGRGIDQVLPRPGDPRIHEPYVRSALGYVELAERANGPIPRPVGFSYIWGDVLAELERLRPDVRIVNLETSVTTSEDWTAKGINYRMHPANIPCITAAKIDCCVLANNHVLDWGSSGLLETLQTLREANVRTAGAGRDLVEAAAPAIMEVPGKGRVIVFALGSMTSGIPRDWAAAEGRPGVNLLEDPSDGAIDRLAQDVRAVKRPSDVVVVSIHWGPNWGYHVSREDVELAHRLIDEAQVDVVHGHSSHHAKGIEVYKGKPVLYGCGDFLNDYEGIGGNEEFRGEIALMYVPRLSPSRGKLIRFEMTPFRIEHFRLHRAWRRDARWLRKALDRECGKFGGRVDPNGDGTLTLRWG